MMRVFAMALGAFGLFAAPGSGVARVLARQADTLRAIPLPGAVFADARAVGVDPFGMAYVADAGRDVVYAMDASGGQMVARGGPGSKEGAFDDPAGVDPTNGLTLYVADAGNRRIQIFSRSGAWLGAIPLTGDGEDAEARVTYRRRDESASEYASGVPGALATSMANELFVVDAGRRVVRKWDQDRRPAGIIGGPDAGPGALLDPVDLALDANGLLYVADRQAEALMVYDEYGTFVRSIGGGLAGLSAVAATGEGVYVALERSLLAYDATGRFARRLETDMDTPIVDVAEGPDGTLYALGTQRLYLLAPSE